MFDFIQNWLPTDPDELKKLLEAGFIYTPYIPLQITTITGSPNMADTVANNEALLKLIKKLPEGFKEEADAMTEEKLRNCVVESSHNLETAVAELKEKKEYKAAKAEWKTLNEPISDIKKAQKAKIQYALFRLENLGKL